MTSRWPWRNRSKGRIPFPIQSWGREHFIPVSTRDLISHLLQLDASHIERAPFLEILFKQIVDLIHLQYRSHHEQLVFMYQDFDPDLDPTPTQIEIPKNLAPDERELVSQKLFAEISDSLWRANYRRLKPYEIQAAVNMASHWGVRLKTRFSSFRRLEVYGRGDIIAKRMRRHWTNFYRLREVDVPIYQRLVVVFRTKELQNLPELLDPDCIHVRMFKNIPKLDVDMMLPGTQVRMGWVETGKIGVPTLWGVVMLASKIARNVGLVAMLGAAKFVSSFFFVIAIVVASLVYGIKSIFSYTTAKRRYQLNVARNLYYQNLDNNLGALLRLLEEAEQQESCEALLGYYILNSVYPAPMTSEQIDHEAERILLSKTGISIDFDVQDALRDLAGMGIVNLNSEGWASVSIDEATEKTHFNRF